MKISEDVRKYAAEQNLSDEDALKVGMERKARDFTEAGAESTRKRRASCPRAIVTWVSSLIDRTNTACAERLAEFLKSNTELAFFVGSGLTP